MFSVQRVLLLSHFSTKKGDVVPAANHTIVKDVSSRTKRHWIVNVKSIEEIISTDIHEQF